MQRFDVLVVGGGPAGSATAHHLAAAGVSVLLADRATFPRDKPCGGGLTTRAFLQCPVDPTPVVEEEVDLVELRFRYGASVVRRAQAPVIRMTQRRRLDAFLLDAAREAGVTVREGARRTGCRGSCRRGAGRGDVVVGADGATASARGHSGSATTSCAASRSRETSRTTGSSASAMRSRAVIELADIPGGYGWVFPKGDHVNVGVGAWEQEGPRLRDHLRRVCEAHGLDSDELSEFAGIGCRCAPAATRIASDRALLVGDAAGLIDPVSGDGMYECFVSARLASGAIVDLLAGVRALSLRTTLPRRGVAPLHRASWMLKRALDRWPRLSWRIARKRSALVDGRRLLLAQLGSTFQQQGVARSSRSRRSRRSAGYRHALRQVVCRDLTQRPCPTARSSRADAHGRRFESKIVLGRTEMTST